MLRLIRTSLALGLAAVAVAVTSVMPAHAAEGQQPRPPMQQFLFQPDVRVNYYLMTETSTVTTFNWKIGNIGVADSGPITVFATCHGDAINGTKVVVSKTIAGLKSGQHTYLSYKCAGGQKYWVETNITVSTQDDLDLSNNTSRLDND